MSSRKATPGEIHTVMEQQKKLKELQGRLAGLLNKVNETINSITVENIQLTSYQIDEYEKEEVELTSQKPAIKVEIQQSQQPEPQQINKQLIDLEMQNSNIYDIESDEDLDEL